MLLLPAATLNGTGSMHCNSKTAFLMLSVYTVLQDKKEQMPHELHFARIAPARLGIRKG